MRILRPEGLVIAFKGVQKGYWTFSKCYGHGLPCFITSSRMRTRFFVVKNAKTVREQVEACRKSIDTGFDVAVSV
jgi:hypothetical protein